MASLGSVAQPVPPCLFGTNGRHRPAGLSSKPGRPRPGCGASCPPSGSHTTRWLVGNRGHSAAPPPHRGGPYVPCRQDRTCTWKCVALAVATTQQTLYVLTARDSSMAPSLLSLEAGTVQSRPGLQCACAVLALFNDLLLLFVGLPGSKPPGLSLTRTTCQP